MGPAPPARHLGRSTGVPSRTLGPRAWAEGSAVGLLPIWRWLAHLYGNVIGPARDATGVRYHSSTLRPTPGTRSSGGTAPSHHVACKTWSSYEIRAYSAGQERLICSDE